MLRDILHHEGIATLRSLSRERTLAEVLDSIVDQVAGGGAWYTDDLESLSDRLGVGLDWLLLRGWMYSRLLGDCEFFFEDPVYLKCLPRLREVLTEFGCDFLLSHYRKMEECFYASATFEEEMNRISVRCEMSCSEENKCRDRIFDILAGESGAPSLLSVQPH